MRSKRHPFSGTLFRLLAGQIIAILLGTAIIGTAVVWVSRVEGQSRREALRSNAVVELKKVEEKWRAWKQVGLDVALNDEIQAYRDRLGLQALSVEPTEEASGADIILPTGGIANSSTKNYVVSARLPASEGHSIAGSGIGLLVGLCVIFLGILLSSFLFLSRNIYRPLSQMAAAVRQYRISGTLGLSEIEAEGEIASFKDSLADLYNKLLDTEKEKALIEVATQVAHDIRSPLAALKVLRASGDSLPSDLRELVDVAVGRIEKIILSLLRPNQDRRQECGDHAKNLDLAELKPLVEALLLEKRAELKSSGKNRRIQLGGFSNLEGLVGLGASDLLRVVSNLLNNAIEATSDDGLVSVEASVDPIGRKIKIAVRDNGLGISAERLTQVGNRGVTFGKLEGNGLGLFGAKRLVEGAKGSLSVESTMGIGTVVEIVLPFTDRKPDMPLAFRPPPWQRQ